MVAEGSIKGRRLGALGVVVREGWVVYETNDIEQLRCSPVILSWNCIWLLGRLFRVKNLF